MTERIGGTDLAIADRLGAACSATDGDLECLDYVLRRVDGRMLGPEADARLITALEQAKTSESNDYIGIYECNCQGRCRRVAAADLRNDTVTVMPEGYDGACLMRQVGAIATPL